MASAARSWSSTRHTSGGRRAVDVADRATHQKRYGPASRLLHALALERPFVAETWLDVEELLHGRNLPVADAGAHVFVTGLARAGTTMLMRLLHASGRFASLTYRDMPFVLAPNLWASLTRRSRRNIQARERAHGDGVVVDADSPEALDEVFWRVVCGSDYIGPNTLSPMEAGGDAVDRFRRYVALVLKRYGSDRYLSKNNNNLLRLPSIRRAFPNAHLVVPFRDPLRQAASLLTQHRRFSQQQRDDPFTRRYMAWLVHHEFGLDHRPFAFAGSDTSADADRDQPAYWLQQWMATYSHVLECVDQTAINPIFVSYEWICAEPERACEALASRLDLPPTALTFAPRRSPADTPAIADHPLVGRARELYAALEERSRRDPAMT